MRELAFLNKGLCIITLLDKTAKKGKEFTKINMMEVYKNLLNF